MLRNSNSNIQGHSNAAAGVEAGPRRSASPTAVLGEVLVNQSALRTATAAAALPDDEDLALAKVLQEQERAFLMISGGSSLTLRVENVPPAAAGDGARAASAEGSVPLTDEELAWRLMQEEEDAFQNRLLALAGAAPGEEGGHDGGGSEDGVDPGAMSYEELTALGEVVGTVSTGITPAQLDALPVTTFSQCKAGTSAAAGEEEEQCSICRVEFEGEDEVKLLPCNHFYHTPCIAQWLAQKKVCPQCSKEVVEETGDRPSAAELERQK